MRKDYEKLFAHLESPEPPKKLLDRIMSRIHQKRTIWTFWRLAFFAVALFSSVAALVPFFRLAQTSLVESGFTEIFSLIFVDVGTVITYWNSFLIALLESLPVISIVLFLAVVFVFLKSLQYAARDIKIVLMSLNCRS